MSQLPPIAKLVVRLYLIPQQNFTRNQICIHVLLLTITLGIQNPEIKIQIDFFVI